MKKNHQQNEAQIIEHNRKLVMKEVNRGVQFPLDRSIFKQTQEQREAAWSAKSSWKKAMQKCYPDPKIRKFHNNPTCF